MESTDTKKIGSWLLAAGCFIAFVGLCFLPSAFGSDPDRSMLGAGLGVFSLGMLMISGGVYAKARALGQASSADAPQSAKRKGKSNCDKCGEDEPVIQCRVHQVHLCADCLGNHYDFRACAYVPSTRRAATVKSTASAYSQTASS
jgi:hypothetical protein